MRTEREPERGREPVSYKGLHPASKQASSSARGASKKKDTKPEVTLRKALWHRGLRYRKHASELPGKPDLVFPRTRVAVFCDGNFWHGKDWANRRRKLERGNNPEYWIGKIERNMCRDRANNAELRKAGWVVLRYWESEILGELDSIVTEIETMIAGRRRSIG